MHLLKIYKVPETDTTVFRIQVISGILSKTTQMALVIILEFLYYTFSLWFQTIMIDDWALLQTIKLIYQTNNNIIPASTEEKR